MCVYLCINIDFHIHKLNVKLKYRCYCDIYAEVRSNRCRHFYAAVLPKPDLGSYGRL